MLATALLAAVAAALPAQAWKALGPGLEYTTFALREGPPESGQLHVVRLDPARVELSFGLVSQQSAPNRTAGAWAESMGYGVAINAGMFQTDYRSNVGYLRHGAHLNNGHWNKYQSVLVFGPTRSGLPAAALLDLDAPGAKERAALYASAVQNLRLIKGEGQSVWKASQRRWSESAVAQDKQGRLLWLFARQPLSMAEFIDRVLALPLGVVRAMHVEGGPEASLSIRAAGLSLDLFGSFETSFNENDDNARQWALPSVLLARPKVR